MEHVTVTPDMRQRVVHKVECACSTGKQTSFQIKNLLKWMLPIAACFVLVLGLIYLPSITEQPNLRLQITNQIIPAESLQELSDMVGFEAAGISDLPFDAQTVTYTAYWNQIAETKYMGETNTCVLRQSVGTEDISGDYTSYAFEEKRTVNGVEVLLKGHASNEFLVAVWHNDVFSFAVTFTEGVPFDAYEKVIVSTLK